MSHHRLGVLFVAAVLLLLAGAQPARAAELSLSEPSACDIGDELSDVVERALGQPLAAAADVRCRIEVLREGELFTARLVLDSAGSERALQQRSFSAPSCEKLTELLAVAVVLAVGSGSAEVSPSPESPAEAAPPSPAPLSSVVEDAPAAPTLTTPEAPAEAQPDERSRWSAQAALAVDAGSLPAPGLGTLLGASLDWQQLELRVLGTYLFPRSDSLEASAGSPGAELALLSGSLLGCAPRLVQAQRLELGACAGAELGWLWGSGTGVNAPKENGGLWSAARAEVGARWGLGPPWPWLGLDVRLGALLPLERHRFAITNDGDSQRVHQPGALVARLSVGVSVELD